MSGNTFNGIIHEFPGIGIDRFNMNHPEFYLLTHFHYDHLEGLQKKAFLTIIYCTFATAKLCAQDAKFKHIIPYLRPLDFDCHEIRYKEGFMRLSLIDSYHCPGSCMFLLEKDDKSVLITGDLRAEEWWVNETLKRNLILLPFTSGVKHLDNLYLDTTFAYRGEPFIDIPSNMHGIHLLIELLRQYPQDDTDIEFCFQDTTSGFEEGWANVINTLDGSSSSGNFISQRISCLEEHDFACRVISRFQEKLNAPKFTLGSPSSAKCQIKIRQCIDFNIVDWIGTLFPVSMDSLSKSELESLTLLETTTQGHRIYSFRDRQWILPCSGLELLPTTLKFLYSRHSSYRECRNLVSILRPREIYPCSGVSRSTWMNGFSMRRIFGDICLGNDFRYDEEMRANFGSPLVLNRAVKTINRWEFGECQSELDFVRLLASSKIGLCTKMASYELMGISEFGKNYMDHVSRCRDMNLQNIISGRCELGYKEKIKGFQRAYADFRIEIPVEARRRRGYTSDSDFEEESHQSSLENMKRGSPRLKRSKVVSVKSSFNSQEISFEECSDPSEEFVIGNTRVNTALVKTFYQDLQTDPSSWFSFNLKSIN